jgi:ABC-2 type transport system ATP-binding protein
MIEVKSLTKNYPGTQAVRGISFEVAKGEIVGFLGPNGAGKSTTMRILTGFLPMSSGEVTIAGCDLLSDSITLRKRIGYMPESVPLYTEMRVADYLEFRGALKGVKGGRNLRNRVAEVMERCSLSEVSRKLIGHLSKGFRQRVGLADALVHNPELLILDEPTSGLDPNQIRAVRQLIKDLGKDHTILLSTHILSEVENVCTRAIIINKGRIEASDTLENLGQKVHSGSLFLEVKAPAPAALSKIEKLGSVGGVSIQSEKDGWSRLECVAKPGHDIRDDVYGLVKKENWDLRDFHRGKATLEDVFVELTQD